MNPRLPHLMSLSILLALLLLCRCPAARAALEARVPPITYGEMLHSELVVVGSYESHADTSTGQTLTLRVLRALKGTAGDRLTVKLQGRYSIQRTDQSPFGVPNSAPAGVPQLCYDQQVVFGSLEPFLAGAPSLCYGQHAHRPSGFFPSPILKDARQPAIYFFPRAAAPALSRRGQVQAAEWADDWGRALEGIVPGLAFCLFQGFDGDMQQAALEELAISRDPAVIDRLFGSNTGTTTYGSNHPYSDMLIAIGDRNGDVYDRAMTRVEAANASTPWQQDDPLAAILAQVDPHRAMTDFNELIRTGSPALRLLALRNFGYTGMPSALDMAFHLLQDPVTLEHGVHGLEILLDPERKAPDRKASAENLLLLRRLAHDRLFAAVKSLPASPEVGKELRELAGNVYGGLAEPDYATAAHVLLSPETPTVKNPGPIIDLLDQISLNLDPQYIPLLWKMVQRLPDGGFNAGYFVTLVQVMERYSIVFPNAMRREVLRQGLKTRLHGAQEWSLIDQTLFPQAPQTVDDLADVPGLTFNPPWPRHEVVSAHLLAELRLSVAKDVTTPTGPDARALQTLLFLDPAHGKPLFEQALRRRSHYAPDPQDKGSNAELLALAVRYGHPELAPALLQAVRTLLQTGRQPSYVRTPFDLLLLAHNPNALLDYLNWLDTDPPTGEGRIKVDRFSMIDALFPAYPGPYFRRVLPLLESPRLSDRKGGQSSLFRSLYGDFGFHPEDLPAQRTHALELIRPLLERLSRMDEPTMRRSILQQRGITLSPPSSFAEIGELAQATSSLDGTVAFNALALIDLRLGTRFEESLGGLPPLDRSRAVLAFLRDRDGTMAAVVPGR